jgi:PAS domain S-box-containing protein
MLKDDNSYSLLIVEDNPGDALLIEEFLREYIREPRLHLAASFRETRALLVRPDAEFDLILLDLTLPDLHGEELIKEVLVLSGDVPVVILTGYGDMTFSVRSLKLGVSDYFLKDDLTAFSLYKSIIYNIERKKSIKELTGSKKRYNDLFHLSPQPMCVYALDTLQFLDANQAAVTQYGYTKREFLNIKLNDLWYKEEQTQLQEELKQTLLLRPGYLTGVYRLQKKDGTVITVEVHSNRMDYDGMEARIILATDITRRIEHANAIEAQNARLREIAWTQSHVVRAPLARLMGLVELYKLSPEDDAAEREFCLQEIDNSARELDRIIRDISEKTESINLEERE